MAMEINEESLGGGILECIVSVSDLPVDSVVNKDSLLYYEYTIDVHLFSFGS